MKGWILAFALSQAADVGSTCLALRQPGAREANPLVPGSCVPMALLKAGVTGGAGVTLGTIGRDHPRFAKVLLAVGAGVGVAVTAHNLRGLTAAR